MEDNVRPSSPILSPGDSYWNSSQEASASPTQRPFPTGKRKSSAEMNKARNVFREQFALEVSYKEGELELIEERIQLAKMLLQRLRLGILAQHYGEAAFCPTTLDYREETIGKQGSWEVFEREFVNLQSGIDAGVKESAVEGDMDENPVAISNDGETVSESRAGRSEEVLSSPTLVEKKEETDAEALIGVNGRVLESMTEKMDVESSQAEEESAAGIEVNGEIERVPSLNVPTDNDRLEVPRMKEEIEEEESRFYSKKRVIVGNTSQYLDPVAHQHVSADGSTHKWMVYVRGSQTEPDISHFVKAVRFFLHPSYHPNDIVRVRTPPFHLTRHGWGEFPIRVQLEFKDRVNKPVDILHNLVLDRTHTGQQTLGAETIVDLGVVMPALGEASTHLNGFSSMSVRSIKEEYEFKKTPDIAKPQQTLSSVSSSSMSSSATNRDEPTVPHGGVVDNQVGVTNDRVGVVNDQVGMVTDQLGVVNDQVGMANDQLGVVNDQVGVANDVDELASECSSEPKSPGIPSVEGANNVCVGNVITTNLDKCLHTAVRGIPICSKVVTCEEFYIPAPSLAQYRTWNIGRRRATEWMRAVAVKKTIQKKLHVRSLLSTRRIMAWCRQNGYTPLDPAPQGGRGFCKICGCQLGEEGDVIDDEDVPERGLDEEELSRRRKNLEVHEQCHSKLFGPGSYLREGFLDLYEDFHVADFTGEDKSRPQLTVLGKPDPLMERLFSLEQQLRSKEERGEEAVDTEELPPSPSCARSRALVDIVPRFRVPQTPELKWIQKTASSIGIKIYPAVIDRMYAHVVEHMIYISCTRFLRGILGQAIQGAWQGEEGGLSQDRILAPFHLQQAIIKLEHCDFLTNRYLGVAAPPKEGVAGASGYESSVSSSSCGSSDEEGP